MWDKKPHLDHKNTTLLNVTGKVSFIIVDDYDFFSSGVKLAIENFISKNSEILDYFIAPKYIGNFIVIKNNKINLILISNS